MPFSFFLFFVHIGISRRMQSNRVFSCKSDSRIANRQVSLKSRLFCLNHVFKYWASCLSFDQSDFATIKPSRLVFINELSSVSMGNVTSYHVSGCSKSVETLEQTSRNKNKIMDSQKFQPNEYSILLNSHSTNEQNKSFNCFKLFN